MTTEICSVYLILTVLTSSHITCRFSLFYRYKYILVVFSLTVMTEILIVLQNLPHLPNSKPSTILWHWILWGWESFCILVWFQNSHSHPKRSHCTSAPPSAKLLSPSLHASVTQHQATTSLQTSSSEVQPKCLLHFKPEALIWFMSVPSFGGCKPCHKQSRCLIFSMWAAKVSEPQSSLSYYGQPKLATNG